MADKLKIYTIRLGKEWYASLTHPPERYTNKRLSNYVVNGKKPDGTFTESWFKTNGEVKTVQQYGREVLVKEWWALREKFHNIDTLPLECNTYDEVKHAGGTEELYLRKTEWGDAPLLDVEFETIVLFETDDALDKTVIDYKINGEWASDPKITVQPVNQHIDKIVFPELFHHNIRCKLSDEQLYNLVRKTVKDKIDLQHASIGHNFSTSLKVSHRVPLLKPYKYQYNLNNGTKRKPKYETRTKEYKYVTAIDLSPKNMPQIIGNNYTDLKAKVDEYLESIVTLINTPLVQCSCCEGSGILLKETDD